jgi:hypothetical protein
MGKSTKSTQENKPPEWAEPLLRQAAGGAQDLYNQGVGYHAYTGPTQAPLSDATLSGMNSLLAATGYPGAPVSNATWQNTPESLQARNLLRQQATHKAAQPAAAPQPLWYRNADGYYVQAKPMTDEEVAAANKRTTMQRVNQQHLFRGGR